MRYQINPNDFIKKETITYYVVGSKKFKTKKEAIKYVIKTRHLKPMQKHKYLAYIVLYDFTLDEELSKPELDSYIFAYEDEEEIIKTWMNMCKRSVNLLNYYESYYQETQDGRDVRYKVDFYKDKGKGDLELL